MKPAHLPRLESLRKIRVHSALVTLCIGFYSAGCSRSALPAHAAFVAETTAHTPAAVTSICDRHVLKFEDMAGILRIPITGTTPLSGDNQSCEFSTTAFPGIIVTVRPGLGRTTLDEWAAGKMPLESVPLTGVGDTAVWIQPLHEVISQKNAILCDIQIRGGGSDIALDSTALAAAVGALCNKIFAAY